jgi:hypothetical protein
VIRTKKVARMLPVLGREAGREEEGSASRLKCPFQRDPHPADPLRGSVPS